MTDLEKISKELTTEEEERWRKTKEIVLKSIDAKVEFKLLEIAYYNLFGGQIKQYYIDYSLDRFSFHKVFKKTIKEAKYEAMMDTLYKMSEDKLKQENEEKYYEEPEED